MVQKKHEPVRSSLCIVIWMSQELYKLMFVELLTKSKLYGHYYKGINIFYNHFVRLNFGVDLVHVDTENSKEYHEALWKLGDAVMSCAYKVGYLTKYIVLRIILNI